MIENLKQWLAKYFRIEPNDTESYFKNENVTGFLVMWSIFEKQLFNGFLKYRDLVAFSKSHLENWNDHLEKEFQYFHDRYQDKALLENLMHDDNYAEITSIVNSLKPMLSKDQKMLFVLYVVYRYRNNIFHGNKGVESWIKFKPQIVKCVDIMIMILDNKCRD